MENDELIARAKELTQELNKTIAVLCRSQLQVRVRLYEEREFGLNSYPFIEVKIFKEL